MFYTCTFYIYTSGYNIAAGKTFHLARGKRPKYIAEEIIEICSSDIFFSNNRFYVIQYMYYTEFKLYTIITFFLFLYKFSFKTMGFPFDLFDIEKWLKKLTKKTSVIQIRKPQLYVLYFIAYTAYSVYTVCNIPYYKTLEKTYLNKLYINPVIVKMDYWFCFYFLGNSNKVLHFLQKVCFIRNFIRIFTKFVLSDLIIKS